MLSLVNSLYSVLIGLLSPVAGVCFLFSSRGRVRVLERFGYPSLPPQDFERWWHAASMGEAAGLIPVLNLTEKPQLLTVTSPSALSLKFPENITVRIAPFDSSVWYRALFSRARFGSLVVSETEVWPGMLRFARERAVPIAWVNMRMRTESLEWYRRLRWWLQPLLKGVRVLASSTLDFERWKAAFPEIDSAVVVGNSKFDRHPSIHSVDQMRAVFSRLFRTPRKLLVLGSVHPPEVEFLLSALIKLGAMHGELQLVIAPRHREKDAEIADLLKRNGFSFVKRSEMQGAAEERVILLDTFGELESVYACADVAFIGGSLVPLGGHNPLEAAQYGCVILMGASTDVIEGMCDDLRRVEALVTVAAVDTFVDVVGRALHDSAWRELVSTRGIEVAKRYRGASARIVEELRAFEGGQEPKERNVAA